MAHPLSDRFTAKGSDRPIDAATLARAATRGRRILARSPVAAAARYQAGGRIHVELSNGCAYVFPIDLVQGLAGAKVADIRTIKIEAAGLCLYWPKLDVDLYIPNLLKGVFGTKEWMAKIDEQSSKLNPTALKGMFGKAVKAVSIEDMNQSIAMGGGSPPEQVSEFVRTAIRRMHAAPVSFFTEEERAALDAYDGPIVSGDPNGHVPENLEDDDNE